MYEPLNRKKPERMESKRMQTIDKKLKQLNKNDPTAMYRTIDSSVLKPNESRPQLIRQFSGSRFETNSQSFKEKGRFKIESVNEV